MAHEDEIQGIYNPVPPRRAKGNLSYLEFIALVQRLWANAHPDIPLVTSGADAPAKYPCIVYSLQLRKPHSNEPKMRYREVKTDDEDVYLIGGQRFQNIVYFSAVGEAADVDVVEALIEVFEDFMLEFTPVFKELGASEFVYARRLSDREESRPGAGTVTRTVSYMVTTEKVVATQYEYLQKVVRLQRIEISARTETNTSTALYASGSIYDSSPRYYLSGPEATLRFRVDEEATGLENVIVYIPQTNFRLGDKLYLLPDSISTDSLHGFYIVANVISDAPHSVSMRYTLSREGGEEATPQTIGRHSGRVFYVSEDVTANIIDQFHTIDGDATPDS